MRKNRFIILLPLITSWVLASMNAYPDATSDLYRKASDEYLEMTVNMKPNTLDFSRDEEILETSSRLPEAYDQRLNQLNTIIKQVSRAARSTSCDWDVDLSEGLFLEVPHFLYLRNSQRIIQHDLSRQVIKGDFEKITDHLITLYSLPNHLGPNMFLTMLIGTSMLQGANAELDHVIENGMMDPVQAGRLLKAMNALSENDPSRIREGLKGERDLMLASMNEVSLQEMEDWQHDELMEFNLSREDAEKLMNDQEDLLPGLNRYWKDVFDGIDSKSDEQLAVQLETVNAKVEKGDYGQLSKFFAAGPAMGKSIRIASKEAEEFRKRKALIRQIAEGEIDIMQRANAARWYVLAIQRYQGHDGYWWEDEDIRRAVLSDIAMASMAKTCQFAYPDDYLELHDLEFMRWPEHLVPWWLPELDDFIDYFLQEADRDISEGDLTAGIEHLASACRIIAHLSRDPGVPSSMVAGHRCLDVLDRIDGLLAQELTEAHQTMLREALRDIPTTDPFGLSSATKAARKRLGYQLELLHASGALPELETPEDTDDVLYAMAWLKDIAEPVRIPDVSYWPDEPWPDDLAGDASRISSFDSAAIMTTAEDGQQAVEAWTMEVPLPLENLRDITKFSAETLSEQGRIRLINTRRALR